MRWLAVGAVLGWGCATLNTSGMSEHCKRLYDACLDSCAKSRPPPLPTQSVGNNMNWQIDVASCTDGCNKRAKSCQ
ncbi:MAG: hypothetical protein AB1730_14255 [Myxococcota bacterium]|jgi:hypothetical protein